MENRLQMVSGIVFRESLNRPAWTSMQSNGMWEAYKHLHLFKKVKRGYFEEVKRGSDKYS